MTKTHPYHQIHIALGTQHGKEKAIAPAFYRCLEAVVMVPKGLDTDKLGTFSGEVDRSGTAEQVLKKKARLGMEALGLKYGLANEGSFGPHPLTPFMAADVELMVFIDDEKKIEVTERVITPRTNFGHMTVPHIRKAHAFLKHARFPSHGLVVRPARGHFPDLLYKGIRKHARLKKTILTCARASSDGLAHIETDMRAHMNPTRMRVLTSLARKLAQRLLRLCPKCRCPGWGVVKILPGLACEGCASPTDLISKQVYGCPACPAQETKGRSDGLRYASQGQCGYCNP